MSGTVLLCKLFSTKINTGFKIGPEHAIHTEYNVSKVDWSREGKKKDGKTGEEARGG